MALEEAKRKIEEAAQNKDFDLNLSGLGLTADDLEQLIPEIQEKLPRLKYLYLMNNNIEKLPGVIVNLSSLVYLNVSNNQLRELPKDMEKLSELFWLILTNNQLTVFPERFPKVRHLLLDDNPLSALGKAQQRIQEAVNYGQSRVDLKGLGLTTADLEELIPYIKKELPDLSHLVLSDNQLTALPEAMQHLEKLESLNVSNNQLTVLPERLPLRLKYFNLNDNPLSEETILLLQSAVADGIIKGVEKIDPYKVVLFNLYNGNMGKVRDISKLIETNSESTKGNDFAETLKQFLKKIPNEEGPLRQVYNETVKHLLEEIKEQIREGNQNTVLSVQTSLGDLKSFLQQTAIVLARDKKIGVGSTMLDQLIAREKVLEEAKRRIEEVVKNRGFDLNLSGLGLTAADLEYLIPEIQKKLPWLESLNLSNNQLTQLPAEIGKLAQLTTLMLDNNQLNQLPECIKNMRYLSISLCGNPLLIYTRVWLRNAVEKGYIEKLRWDEDTANYTALKDKCVNMIKGLYKDDEDESKMQEILTLIDGEDSDMDRDALFVKYILLEFLSKIPQDQGPTQQVYNETVKYLLQEIKEGREKELLPQIATSLGNCATPVKSFLLQTAIGLAGAKDGEKKIQIDDKILYQLIAREALKEEIMRKMPVNYKGKTEYIELVEALVNTVYLEGAEDAADNQHLKVKGERERSPSASEYNSFDWIDEALALQIAPIFCKTNADGHLIKEGDTYILDNDKLETLKEAYSTKLGILSPIEKEVARFKSQFNGLLQKESVLHISEEHYDKEDVGEAINTTEQADKLRATLRASKTSNPQDLAGLTDEFFAKVKGKIEGLAKKYPAFNENESPDLSKLAQSPGSSGSTGVVSRTSLSRRKSRKPSLS